MFWTKTKKQRNREQFLQDGHHKNNGEKQKSNNSHAYNTVTAVSAGFSRRPSPQQVFRILLGDPEVFPGKMGYVIPFSKFWVYPRVFSQFDIPGKPPKEGTQEAP